MGEDIHILVVDDNSASCQIIKDTLEDAGFRIDIAMDGEVGVSKIRFAAKQGTPYTLCVTDVMLPKVSGIDLLKRAREMAPDMGVIVISAFDEVDPFIKKEAINYGAFAFLPKPIQPSELTARVREYLSGKKIRTSPELPPGAVPFFGTVASRRKTTVHYRPPAEEMDSGALAEIPADAAAPPPPSTDRVDITAETPGGPGYAAAPPPPEDDGEHITKPVPDAEHFQEAQSVNEGVPQGEMAFMVTKCPMCSHLIKIATDAVSGKIWCSNCGILFDKADAAVSQELAYEAPQALETPPPAVPEDMPLSPAGTESQIRHSMAADDTVPVQAESEYQEFFEKNPPPAPPTPESITVAEQNPPPLLGGDQDVMAGYQQESPGGIETGVQTFDDDVPSDRGASPLRILIVEDDLHAGEILQTALDVAGYASDIVESGTGAFDAINGALETEAPYNLVISDVMLPGINGLDLMKRIMEVTDAVDFILVSAFEDEQLSLQRQAESEGALTFFSKPYDYKELIRFIDQFQGQR